MQDWSPGGQLLTGMPSRQHFVAALDQLVRTPVKRPRAHIGALALVQVDNFDRAIERLGEGAGEKLLDAVATALDRTLTAYLGHLLVARTGGDEFGILAPGTNAHALADHLRALPSATPPLLTEHDRWAPTVSVGISGVVTGEILDKPLARAGQALIQARSLGRARIQVYDSSTHQFAADQIDLIEHIEALKQEIDHMRAEMLTDSLTGLRNRDALDEWMSGNDGPATVPSEILFIDFDRLHSFNHTRGQEAGDDRARWGRASPPRWTSARIGVLAGLRCDALIGSSVT